MSEFEHILLSVERGVARVQFNRPHALNAFTRAMGIEILEALERCERDELVRAVVLTGEGRAFSAGADLNEERPRTPEGNLDLSAGLQQIYNPMIVQIRRMPKPVIAAVNGPAVGISCALACACDFIIAVESAYFLLAFVKIGLVPDGGASITLPARIGIGRATQLAMLGDRLPAREAEAWGLVNEVCQDHELDARVNVLAERLATGPTRTYAAIKELFNRTYLVELEAHLGAEAASQYRRGISPEYEEGVRAFRNKRPPDFTRSQGVAHSERPAAG
jgi:2-(1,2-epoxy-1,2-dihydrophenyl)acetyl-CoA isomerase